MEHLLGCPFWMDCSPILLNISYEKSEDFWSVESHKLAINPSLCQWLHMIGWLLVLLIGWLHIFILIDSLLLMMSVFFCFFNTTLHHFVTLISPIEFHHFSWDLRGARRPLTWRTGEFPATAGETHPPGSGWLQMSKFPKSLQFSDDLWSFFFLIVWWGFYLMLGNHDFRDFTLMIVFGFYDDLWEYWGVNR